MDKASLPRFADIEPKHVLPAVENDLSTLKEEFSKLEGTFANPQKGETWGKRRIEYDYAGVVESMEKIGRPLDYSWGVVGHLMGVSILLLHAIVLPFFLSFVMSLSLSLSIYYCPTALSDTTLNESNHHPLLNQSSIDTILTLLVTLQVRNSDELRAAHDSMQSEVIKTRQAMGQSKPLFQALSALKKRQSVWSELEGPQRRIVDSFIRSMENSGVGLEGEQKETFNKLQVSSIVA
jgi:oligopeptidase A